MFTHQTAPVAPPCSETLTDRCSDRGSKLTRCRLRTKTKTLPKGLMTFFKRAFVFCFRDTVPFSQALNLHQFPAKILGAHDPKTSTRRTAILIPLPPHCAKGKLLRVIVSRV